MFLFEGCRWLPAATWRGFVRGAEVDAMVPKIGNSTCTFLTIQPCVQVRCAETPHFPHMGAVNLPASRQFLQGFVMNI